MGSTEMEGEGLTLAVLADSWLFRYSVTCGRQKRSRRLACSCAAAPGGSQGPGSPVKAHTSHQPHPDDTAGRERTCPTSDWAKTDQLIHPE